MPRRFFAFEWPKGDVLAPGPPLLPANRPTDYPTVAFDNLTQQRRLFDPRVIYRDADALLVAVAPTPSPIARTKCSGSTWQPAAYSGAARPAPTTFRKLCPPDGFALGYRSGPELDYVHGWPMTAAN